MTKFPKVRLVVALSVLVGGGVVLHAQPAPEPAPEATPNLSVPMEKEAQLSPQEMETRASELAAQAMTDRHRIDQLKAAARKKKDVIKLNCINDKLLQVKQLLNIIDDAASRLAVAIASNDDADRYHRFTVITISAQKVNALREEAEACIGEEISYLGPLDVSITEPEVPDDPTQHPTFGGQEGIEPPAYASPFE